MQEIEGVLYRMTEGKSMVHELQEDVSYCSCGSRTNFAPFVNEFYCQETNASLGDEYWREAEIVV